MSIKLDKLATALSTAALTIHEPTDAQRQARITFWGHWASADTPVPSTVDLAIALKFCGNPAISRWWPLPGFQDWFLNRDEFRQRMEFMSELCLDELQAILRSKMSSPADKLKAIQLVMTVSNKMPSKTGDTAKYLDEKIAAMNQQQLLDFISRSMAQSLGPAPIDVTPTSPSTK